MQGGSLAPLFYLPLEGEVNQEALQFMLHGEGCDRLAPTKAEGIRVIVINHIVQADTLLIQPKESILFMPCGCDRFPVVLQDVLLFLPVFPGGAG